LIRFIVFISCLTGCVTPATENQTKPSVMEADFRVSLREKARIDANLALSQCASRLDYQVSSEEVDGITGCYEQTGLPVIELTSLPFVTPLGEDPAELCFDRGTLREVPCPLRGRRNEFQIARNRTVPPFPESPPIRVWSPVRSGLMLIWSSGLHGVRMCLQKEGNDLVGSYATFSDDSSIPVTLPVRFTKRACSPETNPQP